MESLFAFDLAIDLAIKTPYIIIGECMIIKHQGILLSKYVGKNSLNKYQLVKQYDYFT